MLQSNIIIINIITLVSIRPNFRGKGDVTIKRTRKIFLLSLLTLIVIGIAVFCFTQWNNIQAAVIGLKYSVEEIDQMQADAKADFVAKTGIDLDAVEEVAAHITPDGDLIGPDDDTLSQNEPVSAEASSPASDNPAISNSTDNPTTGRTPGKSTGKTNASISNEAQRDTTKVETILARFYSMQSSYVSQLEGIKNSAYAEYKALPKEERGTNAKIRIGRAAVGRASALEKECDAKVLALLKNLKSALLEAGLDESLSSDVEYYYASQKSLLKAQYMSKYKKYLS